jgi:membrane protease YdiL (CAAX protease family)
MTAAKHPAGEIRLMLIAASVAVYATVFWPSRSILDFGLHALGNPSYRGFSGIFVPHLLLYSTFTSLVSWVAWRQFARAGILKAPELGGLRGALVPGILAGLVALAVSLAVVWVVMPNIIHWIDPMPWKIAGNIFSNFFEEYIYRGFVLAALSRAISFWPAALISSALWAATHTQYPLWLQMVILVTGVGFSWLARYARSLWAPYTAHMVLDVVADSLVG